MTLSLAHLRTCVRDVVIAALIVGAGAAADVFLVLRIRSPTFCVVCLPKVPLHKRLLSLLLTEYHRGFLKPTMDTPFYVMARVAGNPRVRWSGIVTLLAVIFSPVVAALFGMGLGLWTGCKAANRQRNLNSRELNVLRITLSLFVLYYLNRTGWRRVECARPLLVVAAFTAGTTERVGNCGLHCGCTHARTTGNRLSHCGCLVGGVVQFLFQIPFLRQAGLLVRAAPVLGMARPWGGAYSQRS